MDRDLMQKIDDFLAQWTAAERAGDTKTLDGLLTDDFVGVGPLGFTLPKAAWVGRYQSGGLTHDRFDLDEIQTRIHDRMAVVTARQNQHGMAQGHPIPEAARATLVLTEEDGDWRLAGVHLSFIAGTPGAPAFPSPN
jgi:ketosteroid isomerase-like protein